jgi:hypothetical protein
VRGSYRPDALASLEILFVDQMEALLMQNTQHLHDVLAGECRPELRVAAAC